jgi:hypothetical protein
MFSGWQEISVSKYYRRKLAERLGTRLTIPESLIKVISFMAPWQNRLFRKQGAFEMTPLERANPAGVEGFA